MLTKDYLPLYGTAGEEVEKKLHKLVLLSLLRSRSYSSFLIVLTQAVAEDSGFLVTGYAIRGLQFANPKYRASGFVSSFWLLVCTPQASVLYSKP